MLEAHRSRGYRIACVPQSHVYHVGGATLKKENPQKTYLNFRNNLLMIYKNAPDCQLKKIMLFRKVFDNVAALKFLASGDYAAFEAVRKARRDFKAMRAGYDKARAENMKLAVTTRIPEVLKSSILYKYYLGFQTHLFFTKMITPALYLIPTTLGDTPSGAEVFHTREPRHYNRNKTFHCRGSSHSKALS